MEDLSKYTNLHRRNGRYYFRARIPHDLIEVIGKREIKKSLNTSELSLARSRLTIEQLKADELFSKTRAQLKAPSLPHKQPINLSQDEIKRRIILWFYDESNRQALMDDADRVGISNEERLLILDNLHDEQQALHTSSESTYQHFLTPTLHKLFDNPTLSVRKKATPLIHQAEIELLYRRLERFGEYHEERVPYTFFTQTSHSQSSMQESNSIRWCDLIERFKLAKLKDGTTQKTLSGYKLAFDFSTELFTTERSIDSIKPDDCRNFRDTLSGLPSNAKKRYPNLTLLKAINAASDLPESHLSITTVNGNLSKLSTILEFAVSEGLLEKNPAKNIPPLKQKRRKQDKRQPFDLQALSLIFNAPLYSGCMNDDYGYNKLGHNKPRRHRFWIPLIALFTGMRLNEICQLFTNDIDQIDGIAVIHIRIDENEEKSLKNATSERVIPIHLMLVKLGLLDYTKTIKAQGHKQLFPHLTKGHSGSTSDAFSKWFNRFLHTSGVKAHNEKMVFHSFRHTFRDATREARIPREIVASLGGWKDSDDVMDDYGKGYALKIRNSEIQKISYPINLAHLKPT
jgi:integrase